MKENKIRLLLVEDDKVDQMAFQRYVKNNELPYDYTIAGSIAEASKILKSMSFDVIISDYWLGDGTSFELFNQFKELPVIVTTGTGNEEVAVEAMKLGAWDYLIKDPAGSYLKTLPTTVELALKRKENEKELQNYHNRLESMVKERTAQLQAEIIEHRQTEKALRKSENQLHQAQKMESIGRLAGGIAHDYNNALSVILGYTELAMGEVDPAGNLRANLDEIFKAAMRATDITRQLLAFARKQAIAPRVLDLNRDLEAMHKMLGHLIGEDIDLGWSPGPDLWSVMMDPSQISQILVNLCINARDAINDVGWVSIETKNITFDLDYCASHTDFIPGEFVQLSVSDNGCGMNREILDNIFEPFFTTKDVDKGTGLGLAMVYGIIKQNKGFINVFSEPGKGTSINIYFPRHGGKIIETQEESTKEIPTGLGETILLVEDDLPILKLAQRILTKLGYMVLSAATPNEALDLAGKHLEKIRPAKKNQKKKNQEKIHLIITDVIMPEMNGRELTEQLQSIYPGLKSIYMSGYTADIIARHGVLDKGTCFIQKPFSKNDLAIMVRKALNGGNGHF
jgi:two-component system cell cycle sensor histidine kinase/response regulator CckA